MVSTPIYHTCNDGERWRCTGKLTENDMIATYQVVQNLGLLDHT